jgi:hypothetical protein
MTCSGRISTAYRMVECHRDYRENGTGEAAVKIETSFHSAHISEYSANVAPGASSNDCFGIAIDFNSEGQVVAASVWVRRAGRLNNTF